MLDPPPPSDSIFGRSKPPFNKGGGVPTMYRGAGHSKYNLKYRMPNEILEIIHNGSNCEYHVIIKELVNLMGKIMKNTINFQLQ